MENSCEKSRHGGKQVINKSKAGEKKGITSGRGRSRHAGDQWTRSSLHLSNRSRCGNLTAEVSNRKKHNNLPSQIGWRPLLVGWRPSFSRFFPNSAPQLHALHHAPLQTVIDIEPANGPVSRPNKCHASSNRCHASSNKKLLGTSATLVVTGALLVVTMFATRNKCLTTSNKKNLIIIGSLPFRISVGVVTRVVRRG